MADVAALVEGRGALARTILAGLPEWFGRPEAVEEYVREAEGLPMLAARDGGRCVGFLSLKRQTAVATEACVVGVERAWHRRGVGRALFDAAAAGLVAEGMRYLTVKTLAAEHPDPGYAATRRFYVAIGFEPLEVFPALWGAGTPCLLMVRPLGGHQGM